MKARDLFVETAAALGANRARTLLTVLGVVIGISSVIAMTAIIGGIKESIAGTMGINQARMVNIYVVAPRAITLDDLKRLEKKMPDYECLAAQNMASGKVSAGKRSKEMSVTGRQPKYFEIQGDKLLLGEFYTEEQEQKGEQVAMLDRAAVKALFGDPDKDVVGQTIQVNNADFKICGIIDGEVSKYYSGEVYIPFSTCAARITGNWNVEGAFAGLAKESVDMDGIVAPTTATLVDYFGLEPPDDPEAADSPVSVTTMKSIIDQVNTFMGGFQVLMTTVAAISLLVGGIGIMNMMLTNVTERIREIGLRKALGAHNGDITKQFLLESIMLTLTGGAIGIILGYLAAFGLTDVAAQAMQMGSQEGGLMPQIDLQAVITATLVCVFIGIIFGYYPARRAARLDPVESLHYQ